MALRLLQIVISLSVAALGAYFLAPDRFQGLAPPLSPDLMAMHLERMVGGGMLIAAGVLWAIDILGFQFRETSMRLEPGE